MNEKKLGHGTYGEVWEYNGNAIKKFTRANSFITECATCVAMKNRENVIQYIDFKIETCEIIYPLYDENLEQWYRRRCTDNPDDLCIQILDCLQATVIGTIGIHEASYIHNDLKPQNILIQTTDRINLVIADLGMMPE